MRVRGLFSGGACGRLAPIGFGAIILLALSLRLGPLLRGGTQWAMGYDTAEYLQIADGLNSGCGFARMKGGRCGSPEIVRTPGYPLLLAALPGLRTVVAFQAMIGAFACILVAAYLRPRWGTAAALAGAFLLAIDLPSVEASSQILSDSLFEALVLATVLSGLLMMERERKEESTSSIVVATVCGALAALAVLTRPNGLLLIPLMAAAPLLARRVRRPRKILLAAIAAGIPLATVAGWTARNRVETGVTTYSLIAPFAAYYYVAAALLARQNGSSLIVEQARLAREIGASRPSPWANLTLQHEMSTRARKIIFEHPIGYMAMTAEDLVLLAMLPERTPFAASLKPGSDVGPFRIRHMIPQLLRSPALAVDEIVTHEFDSSYGYFVLALLQVIVTVFVLIGAGLATRRAIRSRGPDAMSVTFLLVAALILLATAAGPEAGARLRLPAVPLLCILGAIGWLGMGRHPSSKSLDAEIRTDGVDCSVGS